MKVVWDESEVLKGILLEIHEAVLLHRLLGKLSHDDYTRLGFNETEIDILKSLYWGLD